jgi:hypothetical protein
MNRTEPQNRAIHLYLEMLAEALNDAGYHFNDGKVIQVDVDFTKENLKESVWRKVQQAMYPEKTSTTQLSTGEVSRVYENINRLMSERCGVHVPFPSREDL